MMNRLLKKKLNQNYTHKKILPNEPKNWVEKLKKN